MKIAIDLNDVIRNFSMNFVKVYMENYNHEFNLDDFELYTNEMNLICPFPSDRAYQKFLYQDYSYELFYKPELCSSRLQGELDEWCETTLKDLDTDENIEVMIVSPMEYANSIQCSYMYLSKIGTKIREAYFPADSSTIWDRCDVLITANPKLLDSKPEGKKTVRILTDYNKESQSDFSYKSLSSFLKDKDNTLKLLNNGEED